MRILITGVSGLFGNNLARHFRGQSSVLGLYNTHPVSISGVKTKKTDLLQEKAIQEILQEFQPEVIFHCAGLTDLDFCEKNRDITFDVNVRATRNMVNSLKGSSAMFVYISSDAVYDGEKGNYTETDPVHPMNYYGWTKYQGEQEAAKHGNTLILRTNIFGWNILLKESLAEWMVSSLRTKKAINGFHDAIFSPIYTFCLADILEKCLDKKLNGLYICGSSTLLSKYEFAIRLAHYFGFDASLVRSCSREQFPFVAKRGKNLSLCSNKLTQALGRIFPSMEESIQKFYKDFERGLPAKIKQENIRES